MPAQSKRTLYIHMGLHKTATSYLQSFMIHNRAVFLERGVGMPDFGTRTDGAHHELVAVLKGEGPDAFRARIDKAGGDKVLVSTEVLGRFMLDPEFCAMMVKGLSPYYDLRIVIALRRQDFLKESVFAQVVKRDYTGPIEHETHYDYDHCRRVRVLENAFGRENVLCFLYRDDGHNPVKDFFLDTLGLSAQGFQEVGRSNVSLHRRKVLFLSHIEKPSRVVAARITAAVQATEAIADDKIKCLMSPKRRAAFLADYITGNEELCQKYDLDAGYFCDPDPVEDGWTPPAPITQEETFAALQTLLVEDHERDLKREALRSARQAKKIDAKKPAEGRAKTQAAGS
ncbi:MAG: hypothetical protein AAGI34_03370 [Pseudomonadota bacterium]